MNFHNALLHFHEGKNIRSVDWEPHRFIQKGCGDVIGTVDMIAEWELYEDKSYPNNVVGREGLEEYRKGYATAILQAKENRENFLHKLGKLIKELRDLD